MDILLSTHLSVPMMQIALLLALSTIALIFGRIKLALLVNYSFTLYWGYLSNIDVLTETGIYQVTQFTFLYFGFGMLVLLLAIIGFWYYQ